MKQIPAPLLTLIAGVVITLASLWLGYNHGLLPEQASEQAPLVDELFNVMMVISTALFIVVQGMIIWFMIRYRQRAGDDTDGIPVDGNLPLEALWTAIPAVLVIGIGVYSVEVFQEMGGLSPGSHPMMGHQHAAAVVAQAPNPDGQLIGGDTMPLMAMTEAEAADFDPRYGFGAGTSMMGNAPDLTVAVTGMQYAWLFNYPNSGIMTGELHIPVGKDVQLDLTAQDVIHSFWVPQFRLKQDALPGQQTGLRFRATKVGTYPVVCAELCGSYHGGMRSQVIVHTQDDYDAWLEQNQVAQAETSPDVVAANLSKNPSTLLTGDFLQPYVAEMGITPEAIAHLHAPATEADSAS